jgi:hypothetical protein
MNGFVISAVMKNRTEMLIPFQIFISQYQIRRHANIYERDMNTKLQMVKAFKVPGKQNTSNTIKNIWCKHYTTHSQHLEALSFYD